MIGVTEGTILWDESKNDFDWQWTDCLSENLKEQFNEQPLFVDFREVKSKLDLSSENPDFRKKAAVFAASIHGKPLNDLYGEDVRIRRNTVRITTAIIMLLIGLSLGLFWFANSSRKNEKKANEETEKAIEQECIAIERGDSLNDQLIISDSLRNEAESALIKVYENQIEISTRDKAKMLNRLQLAIQADRPQDTFKYHKNAAKIEQNIEALGVKIFSLKQNQNE